MAQIISQGLTTPANVTAGGTVQASDVTTLYNTFNAFSIPDTIATLLQSVYSTSATTTITGATSTGPVTSDVSITVPATKHLIQIGAYSWATTGAQLTLQFRANATVHAAPGGNISTSTSGSGMFFLLLGPHDGTVTVPGVGWITGTTGVITFGSTTALPNAAYTSVGLGVQFGTSTIGSTSSTVSLTYFDIWRRA